MKTLLIVEDEKMIRQGIRVMVQRSGVAIEQILDCKNGEEALEILKSQPVDVMFTDIRMPKMDGITLVNEVQKLPEKPKIVAISGYDDFNYAVEMLRNGVYEYLLKPINRDQVGKLLAQLDQIIGEEAKSRKVQDLMFQKQVRHLMTENDISESEWDLMENRCHLEFGETDYRVIVYAGTEGLPEQDAILLQMPEDHGQRLCFLKADQTESYIAQNMSCGGIGVSGVHTGIRECKKAREEALQARCQAFVMGRSFCMFQEKKVDYVPVDRNLISYFVQQFGTEKWELAVRELQKHYFAAKRQVTEPEDLLNVTVLCLEKLKDAYQNVIQMDIEKYRLLCSPQSFENADRYLDALTQWISQMKQLLDTEFEDYRNKEKIKDAIRYIQKNYQKDLNMAMVSNYVSMNYSLFSLTFKQYTGVNFVNYLKKLRIEEAKRLLEQTDEKIIDISRMVGYDNEKHFMKVFKNHTGISPSQYRNTRITGGGEEDNL